MVHLRYGLPGLLGAAALAGRFPVLGMWACRGWRLGDGRWMCAGYSHRTSVTAGTIFDRTRTPLTVWFNVCWSFATAKDPISALALQRTLEIGSYQTAWAMLHRLRSVLVRPGRELLSGAVEVDETFIGGEEGAGACRRPGQGQEGPGLCGRGSEVRQRLRSVPDADHRGRDRQDAA